jgi:hypothetical protein
VTVPRAVSQILSSYISYNSRDEIDPVGRMNVRGVLANATLLPTQNNRAGDLYIVTSGLGDTPVIEIWNGIAWINVTDAQTVASLLAAHRSNLFSNEIHLNHEQGVAATGTAGTPGVEPIVCTIDIPTSTVTLSAALSNADLSLAAPVQFLTTGALPSPLSPSTTYYVIPSSQTTFQIAATSENATGNIPINLSGSQSGTQTAVFSENKYVTSIDPRLLNSASIGAFAGLPSSPIPSASNPFVTAAYYLAQPTAKGITPGGGPLVLLLGDGPTFVGLGGAGTAQLQFKLYHATEPREYVDPSNDVGVTITGVFKDVELTQPLIPSSESTVVASGGFWAGVLYLSISSSLTANARLLYGQQQSLAMIDRGALMDVGPNSAQTTQEAILKFEAISGRNFDTAIPVAEQNINLLIALMALVRYSVSATAGNFVLSNTEFARLRSYTDYASEFALTTDETQIVAGNQTYAVGTQASDVTSYDATITTPDVPHVAIITYATNPAGLSNTLPGHIFVDGAGTRFRVLGYNSANLNKVMIYTGGETVSTATSSTAGQILAGNNPRQLELTWDHKTYFGQEFIPITDIAEVQDEYEALPPGGSSVGVGALSTLIGTNILPNQGSGAGVAGRLAWRVLPKIQNNRYEDRVRLYGDWSLAQTTYPNCAVGNVTRGAVGIEYTGRANDLILYVNAQSGVPYGWDIFVDGVYQSQILTTSSFNSDVSEVGSPIFNDVNYATYQSGFPALHAVKLGLNLDTTKIHTVRIEVTQANTLPLLLSGIGAVFGTSLLEERGRTFSDAAYHSLSSSDLESGIITSDREYSEKVVRYVDYNGARQTASLAQPYYSDGNRSITGNSFTVNGSDLLFDSRVGDVLYVSSRISPPTADTGSETYTAITAETTGSRTLDQTLGFSSSHVEYAYRIPMRPDGTPVVGAPISAYDKELTRLQVADWSAGRSTDIAQLPILSQSTSTTVLTDGMTAARLLNCSVTDQHIEGYTQGIALATTGSEIQLTAFTSRMDVVFCGTLGATTISIEIDGEYSYNITLSGTGSERHSLFYDAQLRSHSVRIYAPTLANGCVIGETILHDLADPSYTGVGIAEYNLLRNTGSKLSYSAAPDSNKILSNSGLRLFDAMGANVRIFGTTPGVSYTQKDSNNPWFGSSVSFNQNGSGYSFTFFGDGFEIYRLAGSASETIYLNGVQLTGGNFPSAYFYSGAHKYTVSNLTVGFYVVTVVFGSGTNTLYAIATNSQLGSSLKENVDDTTNSNLHWSHFKDLRSFLSVLPEQVGLVGGVGTGSGTGTTTQVSSPFLAPQPTYQAVVTDKFDVVESAAGSMVDPNYTNATQNFGEKFYTITYDNTLRASASSGTTVSLSSLPLHFTVKAGDIIYFQTSQQTRFIVGTGSNSVTVDTPINTGGEQVLLSQAITSVDLVNFGSATDGNRLRDIFPGQSNLTVQLDYKDNAIANSNAPDYTGTPSVAAVISNSGLQADTGLPLSTTFCLPYVRPVVPGMASEIALLSNANTERMFVVFFANPAIVGSGSVNALGYRLDLYQESYFATDGIAESAYAYNNYTGLTEIPINCGVPANVGGKTQVQLTWSFTEGLLPNTVESDIIVEVDGVNIKRFLAGVTTAADLTFTEINSNTIQFSQDIITGQPLRAINIYKRNGTKDMSVANQGRLGMLQDIWVGNVADVAAGYANYSSLQTAINSAVAGQKIFIRSNFSVFENVTLNVPVLIEGSGHSSFINGSLTVTSAANFSAIKWLRFGGSVTLQSGTTGIFLRECWITSGNTVTDSGSGNSVLMIGE